MLTIISARAMANRLTVEHRRLLIAHIDKKLDLDRRSDNNARRTLLTKELIKYTQVNGAAQTKFPTHTMLTEQGRIVACAVLAEYADAIALSASFLDRMASPPLSPPKPETIEAIRTAEELLAGGWKASMVD